MEIACPVCQTPGQFAGKWCDNCGALIPADAGAGASPSAGTANPADPASTQTGDAGATVLMPQGGAAATGVGAQFAVVRDGQAKPDEGFTLSKVGEFLVGRMDQETGHQVDVDLRQWVQPFDVGGQKQYLVHRK